MVANIYMALGQSQSAGAETSTGGWVFIAAVWTAIAVMWLVMSRASREVRGRLQ